MEERQNARSHNKFQMKRYIVGYWFGDESKPFYIIPILKNGDFHGKLCFFSRSGKKKRIEHLKNNRLNGLKDLKEDFFIINNYCVNYKKDEFQGIGINFKK